MGAAPLHHRWTTVLTSAAAARFPALRCLGLLLALVGPSGLAQTPQQGFERANQLYQAGKFAEAKDQYEQLLRAGNQGAALEYNLGNACYKSGKLAEAILHYERARRLNPSDEDLRHNLRLANLQVVDKIEVAPRFFLWEAWEALKGAFSLDAITWLGWFAYTLCLGALALLRLGRTYAQRKAALVGALVSGGCCLLLTATFLGKRHDLLRQDIAIVLADFSTLKHAPDATSGDAFVLHAGVKLHILDRVNGWAKIRIADGNVGWIPEKDLGVV